MPAAEWYTKKRQRRTKLDARGINILSIDGGGARGLSSLLILHEIMKRIKNFEGLPEVPSPEEYFDLMGGTGTGGISVAMIGRLRMPTEVAIKAYVKLAEVFSEKKILGSGTSVFKASKLEAALQEIIQESTNNSNETMVADQATTDICKTMVFAMSKHNLNAGIPCIFRSYHVPENETPNCTIWEVLRATTAHPDLFKSISIGGSHLRESFVDGGLGCNNPMSHILGEAARLFPDQQVSSVISIGAGQARTIQIPKPNPFQRILPISAIVATKDIATDSERVAYEMAKRFQHTRNFYFRFNIDQGMQGVGVSEWEKLPEVNAHTRAYMHHVECNELLGLAARTISEQKGVVSSITSNGEISVDNNTLLHMPRDHLPPPPTPVFLGYQNVLDQIHTCLVGEGKGPRVFVLHGLGGAGKTQIVSRFIEMSREHWREIIYLDASSREAIINSLQAYFRSIGRNMNENEVLPAIRSPWFSGKHLLVFDGADDPAMGINDFFPKNDFGNMYYNILITTRSRDFVLHARGPQSDHQITGMLLDDARELLLKSARIQDEVLSPQENEATFALVKNLGCLPLAIVHAGTHIWRSGYTITQYRDVYSKQTISLLEEYAKLPIKVDSYDRTVHTAWLMSYDRLSDKAKHLLWILSCLHPDGICVDIFKRARSMLGRYRPIIAPTQDDIDTHMLAARYLDSWSDDSGAWDQSTFLAIISELLSWSFITYDQVNQTYSLHALVHTWAGSLYRNKGELLDCVTVMLAMSAGWDSNIEDVTFRRKIASHTDAVLARNNSTTIDNIVQFSRVYIENRRLSQAEILLTRAIDSLKKAFGEKHPETLGKMAMLADVYGLQDHWKRAELLQLHILAARKEILGLESSDTLDSLYGLAEVYSQQGRLNEAEVLARDSLCTRQRVFGENDPGCFKTLALLSDVLTRQNKVKESKDFLVKAFSINREASSQDTLPEPTGIEDLAFRCARQNQLRFQEKVLLLQLHEWFSYENQHPDPFELRMKGWLATAYYFNGKLDRSTRMWVRIVDGLRARLGEDHPSTLSAMGWLAESYHAANKLEEAETMQKRVVALRTDVLGAEHSDTLTSATSLVSVYQSCNRLDEAEDLQLRVANSRARVLGPEHYRTLASRNNLAKIYRSQGRLQEAETLGLQVVETCKRVLGEEQVGTLTSISNLAVTYRTQGRLSEAEALQVHVVDAHKRLLGEDNPDTILSVRILSSIYKAQGRSAEHDPVVAETEALGSKKLDESISWRYDYFRTLYDS